MAPSFTWHIADRPLLSKMKIAEPGEQFFSPVFERHKLRWQIELWPNGSHQDKEGRTEAYLCCLTLPPSMQSITVRRIQQVEDTAIRVVSIRRMDENKMWTSSWGKKDGKTARDYLLDTDQFSITVEIHLISVYDKDAHDITHQYLQNDREQSALKVQSSDCEGQLNVSAKLDVVLAEMKKFSTRMDNIQQQIDGIKIRMEEEQKHGSSDVAEQLEKVVEDVNMLKQMNQMSFQQPLSPEQQKLKSWLEKTVNVPHCFEALLEGGIEDLEAVSMLTKNELNDLGIKEVEHQIKLLGAARKLRVQQNEAIIEEGDGVRV